MSTPAEPQRSASRPEVPRPGTLTRLLLRVMGPADITPPDDADRRQQLSYRQLHLGEAIESVGPSPHRLLDPTLGEAAPLVSGDAAARELVGQDLAALTAPHALLAA